MTTIGDHIDVIARRVRDASNTAHSRAFVRNIFTRAAAVINTQQEYLYDTVTLSVGTAGKALYTVETDLGEISRVAEVSVNDSILDEVKPWRDLWKISPTWLMDTASVPKAWAAIGRDRVAIWPAPSSDIAITFTGPRGRFPAGSDSLETGFRDEDDETVRELTVALLLLRQRDLDVIEPVLGRMAGKLGIQTKELMDTPR